MAKWTVATLVFAFTTSLGFTSQGETEIFQTHSATIEQQQADRANGSLVSFAKKCKKRKKKNRSLEFSSNNS